MVRARRLVAVTTALAALVTASPVWAADDDTRKFASLAVQKRKHAFHHEFGVAFGVLPMDAFTKGLTLSGSYTLHFNELIAWEIAQFFYSFHVDTDLKDDLGAFDLRPTPFEVLKFYLTSNVVFKPIYWKGAALNRSLLYGELMFMIGGGYGWFTRSGRPVIDAGAAFRFFLSRMFSVRLDVRYLAFLTQDANDQVDLTNELWIGLGTALVF